MLGGYAHRIARIDLSTGQVEYFAPDPKDLEMYVGGRGLGVKYVFENGPQVDPLGPENLLCIMNGPLSGTRAKMSGRSSATNIPRSTMGRPATTVCQAA